ncbi:MAG: hypothetical protein FJ313_00700 [Gemmatimonadetes bacterium]|nr:hypothetical protein [Gemmatimonadota bacterium]
MPTKGPFQTAIDKIQTARDAREAGMARNEADKVARRAIGALLGAEPPPPEPAPQPTRPPTRPTGRPVSKVTERTPVDGLRLSPDGDHACDGLCGKGRCHGR